MNAWWFQILGSISWRQDPGPKARAHIETSNKSLVRSLHIQLLIFFLGHANLFRHTRSRSSHFQFLSLFSTSVQHSDSDYYYQSQDEVNPVSQENMELLPTTSMSSSKRFWLCWVLNRNNHVQERRSWATVV